jgi:hypothetical protein
MGKVEWQGTGKIDGPKGEMEFRHLKMPFLREEG